MKKFIIIIIGLITTISISAQTKPIFSAEYYTEIQTNFGKNYNWVNLLSLMADVPTEEIHKDWKNGSFHADVIAVYTLFHEGIADDLLEFSNIEEESVPFNLFLFGYEHKWKKISLFGGVRNVNLDYFATPYTSLFVNSSAGIYPTIAANYPLANYPLSAACLHFKYQPTKELHLKTSLYNGVAHNPRKDIFSVFTINPRKDGVAVMSELSYTQNNIGNGFYSLGTFVRTAREYTSYSIWTNIEQAVFKKDNKEIGFLLQGGIAPQTSNECNYYYAAGGYFQGLFLPKKQDKLGIYTNKAFFTNTTERTVELTWQYPIIEQITLQPTFHHIRTGKTVYNIGLLRVIFTI